MTNKMAETELPFDPGIITIELSPAQVCDLIPLLRRQVIDRRGLIFVSIAPYIEANGFRLQAKFLRWPVANKVLKLLKNE
jgi:hypothetical protein